MGSFWRSLQSALVVLFVVGILIVAVVIAIVSFVGTIFLILWVGDKLNTWWNTKAKTNNQKALALSSYLAFLGVAIYFLHYMGFTNLPFWGQLILSFLGFLVFSGVKHQGKGKGIVPTIKEPMKQPVSESAEPSSDVVDLLAKLFSSPNILEKSGAEPRSKTQYIVSSEEIQSELMTRFGVAASVKDTLSAIELAHIQVLASTGYGKKTRSLELVRMGPDLFGLNTETNTREVLSRYLRSLGYEVVYEFPDEVDVLRTALKQGISNTLTRGNSRDLLAIKKQGVSKDVWLIELKGHSGVEDWDFFEGFKQINRILAFRERALAEINGDLSFRCAFAIPGFPVKLHDYNHCYSGQLALIRKALTDDAVLRSKAGKRTFLHFFRAIEIGFLDRLKDKTPIFHFLLICGVSDVEDYISGKQFSEFLTGSRR